MKRILKSGIAMILVAVMLACGLVVASAQQAQSLPFADSQFYTQGDYSIHYRVLPAAGASAGRILMIHGMVSSTLYWEYLAAILNENGYDCVLVDLPGFGYSTRESKNVSPIGREELMAGLMEDLAPGESWIVAGHSMGGVVALNLACMYPDLVESLLLYAAAGGGGGQSSGGVSDTLLPLFGFFLDCFAQVITRIGPAVRLMLWSASEELCYTLTYDLSRITKPLQEPGTGSSLLYMAQRSRSVVLADVEQLTIPILAVWGEKDNIVTPESSVALQNALPPAYTQTYWIDSGHMLVEARPAEIAQWTLDFLK